jgi:hypothetical protein
MFKELVSEISRRLKHLDSMTIGFDTEAEYVSIMTRIETYESILDWIKEYEKKGDKK